MPSNLQNRIIFYSDVNNKNPIKDFLNSLSTTQRLKVVKIFKLYQDFGLTSLIPHTKHLTGTPLWEIRIKGKDNIRIIYIATTKNDILVLHGFIKKKQKTPVKELKLAMQRLINWKSTTKNR